MKKIATVTFHWSTNYGAVLQAFALQRYIKELGIKTEIINYIPKRINFIQKLLAVYKKDYSFFEKERNIEKFRKNELSLSKKTYRTNKALRACANDYDTIVCGSDQIWNVSFTMGAEKKPTLSYFLNFAGAKTKKIAYACSFGTDSIPDDMKELITPELKTFSNISVRENSAREILEAIGIESEIVIDPTLLIDEEIYSSLAAQAENKEIPKVFSYILHSGQENALKISDYIAGKYCESGNNKHTFGIYDWLYREENSRFIVTNSFHSVVFALIFHTDFIAISVEKKGMNNRLITLLSAVGLEDRFVDSASENDIEAILERKIDWDAVDNKLDSLRERAGSFLSRGLSE